MSQRVLALRGRDFLLPLLGTGLLVVAALVATVHIVFAQDSATVLGMTQEQWYEYVCGDQGAVFKFLVHLVWPMAVLSSAYVLGLFANSAAVQRSPLGPLVNLVGGSWRGWLRDAAKNAAKAAPVLVLLILTACTGHNDPNQANPLVQAPVITIDTTGKASAGAATPAPDATHPLDQIAVAVGNLFASDDANALNLATPAKDQVAVNFFTDLATLANSLKGQAAPSGPTGALTMIEQARLAIGQVSQPNALLVKTLVDGIIFANDTKAKALAVPAQVTALLNAIAGQLIVGGAVAAAPLAAAAGL